MYLGIENNNDNFNQQDLQKAHLWILPSHLNHHSFDAFSGVVFPKTLGWRPHAEKRLAGKLSGKIRFQHSLPA